MRNRLVKLRARALADPVAAVPFSAESSPAGQLEYALMAGFSLLVILSGFLFGSLGDILPGLGRILLSTSVLLSDYIAIGGAEAAFINSGLMMALGLLLAWKNRVPMRGALMAAIFLVGGFSLFGKNPLNALPILLGASLYARFKKEALAGHLTVAYFGLALGPLVSFLAFGLGWPVCQSLPLALLAGLIIGFLLPPLAARFLAFHQGFSLYNVGFTCGMVGLGLMALLRAFGLGSEQKASSAPAVADGPLFVWIMALIALAAALGFILSVNLKKSLRALMKESGQLPADFVARFGIGPVLLNMALLGLMSVACVFLAGGHLTGPTLGSILTVMGFAGFGKHPKNVWPLMAGAFITALLGIWPLSSDGIVIAILLSTNLAPIAGAFGWPAGILAGFVHVAVAFNINHLHGYTNLYNNGFAGGFVAALLVALFKALGLRYAKGPQENGQ